MGKSRRKKKLELRKKREKPSELKRLKAIKDIQKKIDEMRRTYSGCDWCCGGGDAAMDRLLGELAELREGAASQEGA